ncbi:pyrroline-5-carboxylate reductase family protein [Raineyella sp. W15-4]|uniref:pyrroline-5-carboxylate reductase family protein n=1 Tax=Raineyella sp. W15-4 TaxID=3081651 RepID=UPI0029558C7E|nr:pyrroline-5-carboxylate reductase dimerization domain-containing protein [Raineyella sp. W15-4]WOQ15751.1 pyrroline-5-carboxylate reductase dimerization domain-containing protein [Raineyella sp. W15-4]
MTYLPTRVAVLGAGSIGGSFARGLAAGRSDDLQVTLTTRSVRSAAALQNTTGFRVDAMDNDPDANSRAARDADLVVIAVQSPDVLAIIEQIRPVLRQDTVVACLASAPSLAALEQALGPGHPVVRVMPNTGMETGQGLAAVAPGGAVSAAQREAVVALFSRVADVFVSDERQLTVFIGVLGATAYFPLVARAVQDSVTGLGFSPTQAERIARQLFLGAAASCRDRPESSFDALVAQVATPGGTTIAGLDVFTGADLRGTVDAAVRASIVRAGELAG